MRKGMIISVYRPEGRDCTNNGVSARYWKLLLVGEGVPEVFEETPDMPAVVLRSITLGSRPPHYYLVPADADEAKTWVMFGGNFAWGGDSRLTKLMPHPLPIHDRIEQYREAQPIQPEPMRSPPSAKVLKFLSWVNETFPPEHPKYKVAFVTSGNEPFLTTETSAFYPKGLDNPDGGTALPIADYYGEFRGGTPWIHDRIQNEAKKRKLYLEWRDPSGLVVYED